MDKILGVYVSSDLHLDNLIKLCQAAHRKGVEVRVFFTHLGTRLCLDPQLEELQRCATVALCKVGFESNELDPDNTNLRQEAFTSQSWHAEMIYECDRYITF